MEDKKKDEGQIRTGNYVSVDWDTFEPWDTLTDGGDDTPPAETPPKDGSDGKPNATGKTINILGKSFVVNDEALAEQLSQANTEYSQGIDRKFEDRSQELGELRGYKRDNLLREEQDQDAANKQGQPELSTLMYENPEGFVEALKQDTKNQIDGIRSEYQQARATEKEEVNFWNSMWSENQDLKIVESQAVDVIRMIGQKYAHLNLPNTKKTRDFLAEETRNWMKGIAGSNTNGSPDAYVEGSSTTTPTKSKKKEEKPRTSTKDFLDKRREVKRNALAG